jgi:Family of unknown function (DUF5701)
MITSTISELDRQVDVLLAKGYPPTLSEHVAPLRRALDGIGDDFLLVAPVLPPAEAIERVERDGATGFSVMDADDLARFAPIDSVRVPAGGAYLLADVDLGAGNRNVTPDDALPAIEDEGRSPLTIDEGIALVTQRPQAVAKNAGFSLLGSRCGDRRVAALWISQNRPKLGWCWAGNPHTWLGSASCGQRVGATPEANGAVRSPGG